MVKKVLNGKKEYLQLSNYVKKLEQRILLLEIHTNIRKNDKLKINTFLNKQLDIEDIFKKVVDTICLEVKIQPNHFLTSIRTNEKVYLRMVLFYILKEYYKISELQIHKLCLKLYKYKIDRATIYHSLEKMECDGLKNLDGEYTETLKYYYKVLNNLNLI